ncbi:MAG TPA: hypothetical protein VMU40_03595 [Steroidobacteraceae bacterium]|nr:hypothetical protein [Steroidobacteraceae bacterium]
MSQANPVRVYVTHLWDESDDYLRVFEYLESARNFYYRNSAAPGQRPDGGKEAQKEELRRQISAAEAVIGLSSLYERDQDLLAFQLAYAQASNKPVVLLRRFGATQAVPKPLSDLADEVIDWDERALVDAVRRQARHEDTTRWDVVEFKLD